MSNGPRGVAIGGSAGPEAKWVKCGAAPQFTHLGGAGRGWHCPR